MIRLCLAEKSQQHEFGQRVDRILWEDWDPIGINGCSEARNEYRGYAGNIVGMIWNGTTKTEILDYLFWAESERMGLNNKNRQEVDKKNFLVVEKIFTEFKKNSV